ncbi:hypothetical protein K8R03_02135 [Candidatus Kaiserbacteria bacterium]|nr:hypothetical protein [Candidatus Kaiserbacteria bacterium]
MIQRSTEFAREKARTAMRYLSLEVHGLHAAVYVLAAAALLSSLLALVRDRLLAHTFGASTTLDIYYAGFRIPDLIFVAMGALVSVYMLIPELARRNEEEQKDYIDTIIVGFSVCAVGVSLIAALWAPVILPWLFPQLAAAGYSETLVLLTRIMLLQPIFLGFSNILAGVTQARQRYALYAISPLLYNLGIIVGVLGFYPAWGIAGLAWGVVLGSLMHVSIQIPSLVGDGFLSRIPRLRDMRALVHTAMVSVPRALALSMNQIAFLGLTALAGLLSAGSIAVFMFAYNLAAVPLSVIGASYSVAAFPTLARALSRGETEEFVRHVATAARYVFFWSMPASALILILRAHIVRVILGSGAFNWDDTRLTAAAFALLSLALAAQGLMLLLVRGYYAAGKTFMPFLVAAGVAAGTLSLGASGLFILTDQTLLHLTEHLLRVDDIPGSNVLILAFSYALSTILGAVVLALHFEKRFKGFLVQIAPAALESFLAAIAGGLGSYIFLSLASSFVVSSTTISIFVQGFAAGICGILVAGVAYYILGSREFTEVYVSLHARIWEKRTPSAAVTVASSAEDLGTTTSA